jgi:erythromycin esterase
MSYVSRLVCENLLFSGGKQTTQMKTIFCGAFLLLALAAYAQPRLAYNGGFEVLKAKNVFRYWETYAIKGEYTFHLDSRIRRSGRYAMRLEGQRAVRTANPQQEGGFFHVELPAEWLAGKKKATLTAWVRTSGPRTLAGIWFNQFDGPGTPAMHASFTDTLKTSRGWQRLTLELTFVPGAGKTYFGGSLNGPGQGWFDDFTLVIDGQPVQDLATPARPPSSREIAWINQSAVPLLGTDLQSDTRDLDALSEWMGDARVVAVGEPTHGTGEVFRLRLRMFQYLVEKKGFNTLMLEDGLAEAGLLNQYVLTGSDSALRLLKGDFFAIWKTEEMLNLVEWMRQYNREHGPKLQFRGMDMQSDRQTQHIVSFARQYDRHLLGYTDSLARLTARLAQKIDKAARPLVRDSLSGLAHRLKNYVDEQQGAYRNRVPPDSVNWLLLNAAVLAQHYPGRGREITFEYRDSCMAANIISYCRQYPEARLLVWAHNSHISRAKGGVGDWLNQHFGRQYYPVAFATANGTYTARADGPSRDWNAYPLAEPYVGTAEYYLQSARLANYLLPIQGPRLPPEAAWTGTEQEFRSIGFINQTDQFDQVNLRKEFEAVIFMRQTTHSKSFLLKKE